MLEVGTGSGYQAAVMAHWRRPSTRSRSSSRWGCRPTQRLRALGYAQRQVRVGDGYYGWEEHAPYDAILVTAAASHIPPPLIRQLKPGGRMVIPVGAAFMVQQLMLVEKNARRQRLDAADPAGGFVPLTGSAERPSRDGRDTTRGLPPRPARR